MIEPGVPECSVCGRPVAQPATRQHACPFCGKTFGRVDGAKRHTRSCPQKGNRPLPPDGKRGRRLRACDACSRAKVSCDAKAPCARCTSKKLPCNYKWLCDDPSHRTSLSASSTPAPDRPNGSRLPLSFLLNLTDPKLDSKTGTIITSEPEKDFEGAVSWGDLHSSNDDGHQPDEMGGLFFGFPGVQMQEDMDICDDYDEQYLGILSLNTPDDAISIRLNLLVTDLQALALSEPEFRDQLNTNLRAQFFTVDSAQKLLKAYFLKRHYQFPLIHWPTFEPERISLHLLLLVMLTGASYLRHMESFSDYSSSVPLLYRLAQRYAYKGLKESPQKPDSPTARRHVVEMCQAALLVVGLGADANDETSSEITISEVLPLLTARLRHLGLLGRKWETPAQATDWDAFVEQETCVRLLTFTMYMTCLITMFCNLPPLLTISDMSCPLPCNEELWDAASRSDFAARYAELAPSSHSHSFKSLVAAILGDQWTEETASSFRQLSLPNLHGLTCALQPVIFNIHTASLGATCSPVLLRALDRWDALWAAALERTAAEEIKFVGPAIHADELASLSRRIVEVNETEGRGGGRAARYLQRVPAVNSADIHQFIRQFRAEGGGGG